MPNTPYQHIVLDYYVERLRQLRAQRRERLDRIRTRTPRREPTSARSAAPFNAP